jgi:hypothetical protein
MEPEDVAILGAMTVLLFRKLSTNQGTNGRILILGVASLKHFKLNLFFCGEPGLSFKARGMPKLEHLELEIPVVRWAASMLLRILVSSTSWP